MGELEKPMDNNLTVPPNSRNEEKFEEREKSLETKVFLPHFFQPKMGEWKKNTIIVGDGLTF